MSRYWEPRLDSFVVQVLPGELHVTGENVVITTVLGSCVSACLRDKKRKVGGINHFMLPYALGDYDAGSARYGVYALESLVNQVLGSGGKRSDLEVKVFGGGRVIEAHGDIGRANIQLAREFLAAERIAISFEDVGSHFARRIRYWPRTGRVQLQRIPMTKAKNAVVSKERIAHSISHGPGSLELF